MLTIQRGAQRVALGGGGGGGGEALPCGQQQGGAPEANVQRLIKPVSLPSPWAHRRTWGGADGRWRGQAMGNYGELLLPSPPHREI